MKNTYVMRGAHKDMRGFEYLVYSAVSLSLLVVLIALPVAPVFASEEVVESVAVEPNVETIVTEDVADVVDVDDTVTDTPVEEIVTAPPEALPSDIEEAVESESSEEDVVTEIEEIFADEATVATGTATSSESVTHTTIGTTSLDSIEPESAEETQTEEIVIDESETTTTEEVLVEDVIEEPEVEIEDALPEVAEENIDEEVPNEEEVREGETVSVNSVTTDENRFTFSKDECTLARDGAFYCAKATPEAKVLHTDRVFSAPDADGDKEIYVEKDGKITSITSNTFDDDAPYFDEVSNTMVWHRLIDGRYQIISYDFDSEEETQITNDRYNNMQPSRFGEATVWQGWVGDDWEIFLLEDDELTMLTDNTTHDITPSINGNHIVWQAFEGNVWHMKVYDMHTGAIQTIEDTEGGSIENLRFVLVYDTKFETGDIETKGYDLKSGEVLTLGVQPASIPDELPDPEQTGEERALVAPGTQPKTKAEGDIDDGDDVPDELPDDAVLTEEEMDIVIPPLIPSTEEGTSIDSVVVDEVVATTTDIATVTVTPFVEEIETSTDHIEDIIVTPFVEPIIEEVDAQETIVSTP